MTVEQLLADYAKEQKKNWPMISEGFEKAKEKYSYVQKILEMKGEVTVPTFSSDIDMVVCGSLARKEFTSGSDLDWTLLVDSSFDPQHKATDNFIRKKIRDADIKDPGAGGMFGQITFSHELINNIGGNDDSNHNLSRRILFLLESERIKLNDYDNTAYNRVIRGIINEYITHDSGIESDRQQNHKRIPRFLFNDIVRFWRTMCVDFAYKQKEQEGAKWGIRNIKLRTSRRLLFAKGLLMCFYCYGDQNEWSAERIRKQLEQFVSMTPIEVLVSLKSHFQVKDTDLTAVLTSYDEFLGILNDEKLRERLSNLDRKSAYVDNEFIKARRICDNFRKSLHDIFIDNDGPLKELTLRYAIF